MNFGSIPEELVVKEVMTTKGQAIKKLRIMGRGRTGYGYERYTHVLVKVQVANFEQLISKTKNEVTRR